jgi:hypothetical protein
MGATSCERKVARKRLRPFDRHPVSSYARMRECSAMSLEEPCVGRVVQIRSSVRIARLKRHRPIRPALCRARARSGIASFPRSSIRRFAAHLRNQRGSRIWSSWSAEPSSRTARRSPSEPSVSIAVIRTRNDSSLAAVSYTSGTTDSSPIRLSARRTRIRTPSSREFRSRATGLAAAGSPNFPRL